MDLIFSRLESNLETKSGLKRWCKENGLKVSFTLSMTLTKSKNIYRKLQNTYLHVLIRYKKIEDKFRNRWLEN